MYVLTKTLKNGKNGTNGTLNVSISFICGWMAIRIPSRIISEVKTAIIAIEYNALKLRVKVMKMHRATIKAAY